MSDIPTSVLAFGVIAGLFFWLAVLVRPSLAKVGFGIMLFVSSIAIAVKSSGVAQGSWLYPVQANRSVIFVSVGALLFGALLFHVPKLPLSRTSVQAWFLLFIGIYQGVLRGINDGINDGLLSLLFTILTIGTLVFFIPLVLRDLEDWFGLIRLMGFVGIIWMAGTGVQIILNPSKVFLGNEFRFIGIGSNPQLSGAFLAIITIVSMWLVLHEPKRRYHLLWLGLAGLGVIFTLGTGSRTGTGMAVLGLTVVLFRRFGRASLMLPLAAASIWLVLQATLWLGIELPFHRIVSSEDTRTAVWGILVEDMMQNPVLGTGIEDESGSENSFLYGGARFGIGMLVLLGAFALYSAIVCIQILRRFQPYPWLRPFGDLIIGFNIAYFGGALLEGYLLARVNAQLVFMLIFAGITSSLFHAIAMQEDRIVGAVEDDREDGAESIDDEQGYLPAPTA